MKFRWTGPLPPGAFPDPARARNASLILGLILLLIALPVSVPPRAAPIDPDPYASAPAYVRSLAPGALIAPLLTVGAQIALLGGQPGESFRLVGLLNGIGLLEPRVAEEPGRITLLVDHGFEASAGGPAGAFPKGARVSEISLESRLSDPARIAATARGRTFIRRLFTGDPPREVQPQGNGLARLSSAFLATSEVDFDRSILLHGEGAESPNTFDGRGGIAFATFDSSSYALPRLGRAKWENLIVAPHTGRATVIFGFEDGPSGGDGLNSQLYIYLGTKQRPAADALTRNGLNNGSVSAFVADVPKQKGEAAFKARGDSILGHWVPIDWNQTDVEFDRAARNAGAFAFAGIEDGAIDPSHPTDLYFVTAGKQGSINPRGRLYRLTFDPRRILGGVRLTLVLDGSEGIIGPHSIDINRHGEIAIQEDPASGLTDDAQPRDSSIWMYNIGSGKLTRVAEIDRKAAVAHALAAHPDNDDVSTADRPGGWQTSGIIDAELALGRGAWIFDVQAHSLRISPAGETVEGGQLLRMFWLPESESGRP